MPGRPAGHFSVPGESKGGKMELLFGLLLLSKEQKPGQNEVQSLAHYLINLPVCHRSISPRCCEAFMSGMLSCGGALCLELP